jgi:hypothetical protein
MNNQSIINTVVSSGGVINSTVTSKSTIASTLTGGGIGPQGPAGAASTQITVAGTAPSSPYLNDLWIDTSS